MHAKVLAIDYCRDRQHIKCLHNIVIEVSIIAVDALLSEIELFSHLTRLVIPSQHVDVIRKTLLKCHQ